MDKLVIEFENSGDMSVGIPPLFGEITINANIDIKEILTEIHYKDNLQIFKKDIHDFITNWIDDMGGHVTNIKIKFEQ